MSEEEDSAVPEKAAAAAAGVEAGGGGGGQGSTSSRNTPEGGSGSNAPVAYTTVMLRNIPNKYTRNKLVEQLEVPGNRKKTTGCNSVHGT